MPLIVDIIEIIGVLSFSISGAIMAIDKENDFIGVVFLAIITAFGGGVIRDVLIGNTPPIFFRSFSLILISFGSATLVFILAMIFKKQYVAHSGFVEVVNNYFDALGLSVFVISGAKLCMELGITNPVLIISMGVLSGTGGSMTRDIIMNEVSALLRKRIYLLAALIGATLYYLFVRLGVHDAISYSVSAVLIVLIRILATVFKWNLPKAIKFDSLEK